METNGRSGTVSAYCQDRSRGRGVDRPSHASSGRHLGRLAQFARCQHRLLHRQLPLYLQLPLCTYSAPFTYSVLNGVAAAPNSRAWAVGDWTDGTTERTLILHWDGSVWQHQASPSPGSSPNKNELYGVADTSATNAWAVGQYNNGSTDRTLIERWNGGTWSQVASPSPGAAVNQTRLYAVTAISATNAWAVGYYYTGTKFLTLIEHWNGVKWKQFASPSPGGAGGNFLTGVAATSATNAWAVGYDGNGSGYKTLIEHWNGSKWKQVASPSPGTQRIQNELNSVTATSTKNAWAVGSYGFGSAQQTLIEHWNGSKWKQVASINPAGSSGDNELFGVASRSARRAWAVGFDGTGSSYHTLIERWNGSVWKHVASPSPGPSSGNFLGAVAINSADKAWATGNYYTGVVYPTLGEHWNGIAWQKVFTPSS